MKTDVELAYDLRYYNRYGDLLVKRIQSRNFYERLGKTFGNFRRINFPSRTEKRLC